MSANKLTETLDSLSDKAFGFKDKSEERNAEVDETAPTSHDEDKTETLNTSHDSTAEYPVAEPPTAKYQTEEFDPEFDPASQQEQSVCEKPFIPNQRPFDKNQTPTTPVGGEHAVSPDRYPQPPVNPPSQHPQTQEHNKPELKTGPEQDFTVATVAGFMGVLCLLLMFTHASLGLLAIVFGATAVFFARITERAGTAAGIGKTLGWFSFFGGIAALLAAAFFLFVAFVVLMVR